MNKIKKGIVMLLCVLMCVPSVPSSAETRNVKADDVIRFNTGSYEYCVVNKSKMDELYTDQEASAELNHYVCYDEEGNYTIPVEVNAFFPYEVQFTYGGETVSRWFQTREDTVEIGGHTFSLNASADGDVVTQMSLNIGGDTVVVYPQKKEFTNDENSVVQPASLYPLVERKLTVDIKSYSPIEMTKVSFDKIFAGETQLPDNASVMWNLLGTKDDYQYGSKEGTVGSTFDLSVDTYGNSNIWEMIVGEKDQLAPANIRYIIEVQHKSSNSWLIPEICKDNGMREQISTIDSHYYDNKADSRYLWVNLDGPEEGSYFISLQAEELKNRNVKVFEGSYTESGPESANITAKILNTDMSEAGSGYLISFGSEFYKSIPVTFISYDENGSITGCLPIELRIQKDSYTGIVSYQMENHEYAYPGIVFDSDRQNTDGINDIVYQLYKEYPANGSYIQRMEYQKDGKEDNSSTDITAYLGRFDSIAEAVKANAEDVKASLFGNGYAADYSNGVIFSIFIGPDGPEQKKYCYRYKTVTGEHSIYESTPSSSTLVRIRGVAAPGQSDSALVDSYVTDFDSYADNNYYMILTDNSVDLTNLALVFDKDDDVTLYGEDATQPEESGKVFRDFSNLVQFTASSEDKKHSENYFVQVVKAEEGKKLWINSLNDTERSNTRFENGVTYSSREVVLDTYHNERHDILVANMGTQTMSALAVELKSDYLELDDYWTLSGNHDLSGFVTAKKDDDRPHGELPNLAKVRLKVKADIEDGQYDNLGTLVFTSEGSEVMVLALTGVIGNPRITMKEIKNPTKYVPYGTMIMNSNKYSWNKVSYKLESGKLPDGMELMQNGELYGVPMEAGDFEITVRMKNSYMYFPDDIKTFKFTVLDNTDSNVDQAQDNGYQLTKKISGIYDTTASGDYLIISEGIFDEYTDLYIDGEKLTRGTDYEAESGSTHITIAAQSLKKTSGTHTIGVEFQRNKNKGSVRAAAQNYTVQNSNNQSGSSSGGNSGSWSGGSWNGGSTGNTVTKPVSKPDSGNNKPVDIKPPVSDNPPENIPKPEDKTDNTDGEDTTLSKAMVYARNYTVQNGDTLKSLAKKFYGKSSKWKKIYDANKGKIPASKKLKKGMKLQIPAINYTVKKGDTIKSIAKKYFGARSKWKQIYQINKDVVPSTLKLKTGTKLVIPVPVVCAIYTVKDGDSLEKIAKKYYGKSSKWKKIYDANKNKISVSKKVKAGKKLFIPAVNYTVKKGDDLKNLAKKYYGARNEWRRIYEANKDVISSSKKLKTGVNLVIPVPVDIG